MRGCAFPVGLQSMFIGFMLLPLEGSYAHRYTTNAASCYFFWTYICELIKLSGFTRSLRLIDRLLKHFKDRMGPSHLLFGDLKGDSLGIFTERGKAVRLFVGF